MAVWSAVALQQHIASTAAMAMAHLPQAAPPRLRHDVHVAPAISSGARRCVGRGHPAALDPEPDEAPPRLTLPQKMGLVPGPPPPPTEEDWERAEQLALSRFEEDGSKLLGGASGRPHNYSGSRGSRPVRADSGEMEGGTSRLVCSICQEAFRATMNQGQVLLNCSHVFHEVCLRRFEHFARQMARAAVAAAGSAWNIHIKAVSAPLACPICRTTNYRKRFFYRGKALAQRAMIVTVQSCVRRWIAKRRVRDLRLQHDAAYRTTYVYDKIKALADAWVVYAERQQRRVDQLLAYVAIEEQRITGAMMTEAEWRGLKCAVEQRGRGAPAEQPPDSGGGTAVVMDCPICLNGMNISAATWAVEAVDLSALRRALSPMAVPAGSEAAPTHPGGLLPVIGVPQAAPARGLIPPTRGVAARRRGGPPVRRRCGARPTPPDAAPPGPQRIPKSPISNPPSPPCQPSAAADAAHLPSAPSVPQLVLLSCSHAFHATCFATLERYLSLQHHAADESPATPMDVVTRCPVCRAGYAKRLLSLPSELVQCGAVS